MLLLSEAVRTNLQHIFLPTMNSHSNSWPTEPEKIFKMQMIAYSTLHRIFSGFSLMHLPSFQVPIIQTLNMGEISKQVGLQKTNATAPARTTRRSSWHFPPQASQTLGQHLVDCVSPQPPPRDIKRVTQREWLIEIGLRRCRAGLSITAGTVTLVKEL